jgi:hypothetical protein
MVETMFYNLYMNIVVTNDDDDDDDVLKPHCIRCSHFKVDDISALEAISKSP